MQRTKRMISGNSKHNAGVAAAVAIAIVAGCAAPPAPTVPQSAAPGVASPAPSSQAVPAAKPAPASLAEWKRQAAERIHSANRQYVYAGPPPNPLRAVVVVDITVAPDGQVRRADLLRVPDHSRELGRLALASLSSASPLPVPPRTAVSGGTLRTTETWLFREDGQFQIRSLAAPQSGP